VSDFSNDLTEAQIERLAILAEECGEVVQIVGKIIRHGYHTYSPNDPKFTPNRDLLEKELGDLLWIVKKMDDAVDIDFCLDPANAMLQHCFRRKDASAAPYLHHQEPRP
jgi:NTP pyrophosphatase (non-canonical NTP hydrolase)